MSKTIPQVEIVDNETTFMFRLVAEDRCSGWAFYQQTCYLDGYVAATQYYVPVTHELRAITPDEFVRFVSIGEER